MYVCPLPTCVCGTQASARHGKAHTFSNSMQKQGSMCLGAKLLVGWSSTRAMELPTLGGGVLWCILMDAVLYAEPPWLSPHGSVSTSVQAVSVTCQVALPPPPPPPMPTERERQRAAKQTSDSSCKASLLSAYLLATEEKCGILEEFGSHLGKILVVPR